MNAVTTTNPAPPALRQDRRGAAIKQGLANAETKYLAPFDAKPWRDEDFKELWRITDWAFNPEVGVSRRVWGEFHVARDLGPSTTELDAFLDQLEPAVAGPPDPAASRALVGMMLASFPNGRPPDLEAYIETLLHDANAMGFTPHAVAHACRALRRSLKFLPSVSEFVEACEAARKTLQSSQRVAAALRERMAKTEAVCALPEPPEDPPVQWRPPEMAGGHVPF